MMWKLLLPAAVAERMAAAENSNNKLPQNKKHQNKTKNVGINTNVFFISYSI
jgi:hypothetical protein